jgi:hypothetical protein
MNRSQTKIRKIQESNKIAEERFLMSEQASTDNPVAGKMGQLDPNKKPVSKRLPTDYNKEVTFLFSDNTVVVLKPQKQDISKEIIELLGLGTALTNNVVNLSKLGGAQKICGNNAFNKKVYIFTKPTSDISDWCSLNNINPEYMKSAGIFEIPNKPEFISIGTWKSATPQNPKV